MNSTTLAKIGAGFYVLWGILHIVGSIALFVSLQQSVDEGLSSLASNITVVSVGNNQAVIGLYSYYTWLLFCIAFFVTAVALFSNWKNNKGGFFINLLFVGAVEVGLILFLLIPGIMKLSEGGIGILLYALAAVFSTLGFLGRKNA